MKCFLSLTTLTALLGVSLLLPRLAEVSAAPRLSDSEQEEKCRHHIKIIAIALLQYVQEHNEKFPTNFSKNLLAPYIKKFQAQDPIYGTESVDEIFHCPADPGTGPSYSFNPALAGVTLSQLGNLDSTKYKNADHNTVLMYEGRNGKIAYRHNKFSSKYNKVVKVAWFAMSNGRVMRTTQQGFNESVKAREWYWTLPLNKKQLAANDRKAEAKRKQEIERDNQKQERNRQAALRYQREQKAMPALIARKFPRGYWTTVDFYSLEVKSGGRCYFRTMPDRPPLPGSWRLEGNKLVFTHPYKNAKGQSIIEKWVFIPHDGGAKMEILTRRSDGSLKRYPVVMTRQWKD
jgi:hypothetical protein